MKRITPNIIFYLCFLASSVFIAHRCWFRLHAVEQFVIQSDPLFSESKRQEISTYVSNRIGEHFDTLSSALLAEFPVIASASFALQSNKDVLIDIASHVPFVRVNDAQVLTQNGRLIPADHFESTVTQKLASIAVAPSALSDESQLCAMVQDLKDIDYALMYSFQLTWHTRYEVIVANKENPSIQMVCCAYQLASSCKVDSYLSAVASIVQDQTAGASAKKQWIADVRFENQVILRGSKGGIQHGTYIS